MSVAEYAASEARYIAQCDVGYSQPDRWTWYDNCDWNGWLLRSPQNADCSSLVAGCYNIAAHHEWGEPFTAGYFPRTTWTGSIREECAKRNFADISGSWTGNVPDGGWYTGDIVLSEAASGGRGHVAIIINGGSGESSDGALLAEAWIAEDGSIDGYLGDQTGSEVRIVEYASHPYTRNASWTHALRRRDVQSPLTGGGSAQLQTTPQSQSRSSSSSRASGYQLSPIQAAALRAADRVGCPWWAALAMLWQETGERGANIFGHDAGGAYCGGGEVTEAKFRDFYNMIRNGATSNGVGPAQITYPGYFFNDPDRAWWDPEQSFEVGARLIRDYINAEGDSYEALKRVGSRYNSGTAFGTYDTYGQSFSDKCRSWYEYGRPSGAGEENFWEMAEGIDILKEMNSRLIEISDQTGAGIEGRRFDGPIVGWLKQLDGRVAGLDAKLQTVVDEVGKLKVSSQTAGMAKNEENK